MSSTMQNYEQSYTASAPTPAPIHSHFYPELESISTSSESTSTVSTDPGRVATDFDALSASMDFRWLQSNSPVAHFVLPGAILHQPGRSVKTFQQNYNPSTLQRVESESEDEEADEDSSGSETEQPYAHPRDVANISPFNEYVPPSTPAKSIQPVLATPATHSVPLAQDLVQPERNASPLRHAQSSVVENRSLTPQASREVVAGLPPIDAERIGKLVAAIAEAINWSRTLTENEENYKEEHNGILAILYMLTVQLNQGCPNRHVPLYRSLLKTVKTLTKWCQEVLTHRAQWEWPLVAVTFRGYIQKLKDFHVSLGIDSDPNSIIERLNSQITAHNASRAQNEAMRQAIKQKEREDKLARREAREEIRRMHQQFAAMKRAQKEGVDLAELLVEAGHDTPPREIENGSAGSRSTHERASGSIRSIVTSSPNARDIPSGPPISVADETSLSSLGNVIARPSIPVPFPTEASPRSTLRSPGGSKARNGSAKVSAHSPLKEASSPPSIPSSKPLPHRPFSMTDRQTDDEHSPEHSKSIHDSLAGLVAVDDPGTSNSAPALHILPMDPLGHESNAPQSIAPGSPTRSNRSVAPIPPIHVTPSVRSISLKSEPPLQKDSSGVPPEYQYSTMPEPFFGSPMSSNKKTDDFMKATSPTSSNADLLAAFDRIANYRSGGSTHKTESRKDVGHEDPMYYPGLTRSGSPPSTAKPRAYSASQSRKIRSASGPSIMSPVSEDPPDTEYELDGPMNPYPHMNQHGWLKTQTTDEGAYFATNEMPHNVRIRFIEESQPRPGIMEVLEPMLPAEARPPRVYEPQKADNLGKAVSYTGTPGSKRSRTRQGAPSAV